MRESYLQFTQGESDAPEDLVLALDVSPSMEARDFRPSRLRGAQAASRALLKSKAASRPDDRVGVVTFARSATCLCELLPLRTGRRTIESRLKNAQVDSYTNISAGLQAARRLLSTPNPKSAGPSNLGKAASMLRSFVLDGELTTVRTRSTDSTLPRRKRVLVLTDGGDTTNVDPSLVADAVKTDGITIDVIGIGGRTQNVDERVLKRVASLDPHGNPRYCFIKDTAALVDTFEKIACQSLKPLGKGAA